MSDEARDDLLAQVREYHRNVSGPKEFVPGQTPILSSGAVLDEDDRAALVEAALDMRIAAGAELADVRERGSPKFIGVRKAHLTNSGSSANLLALSALTSPQLGTGGCAPATR